jgi:hypothetical protein
VPQNRDKGGGIAKKNIADIKLQLRLTSVMCTKSDLTWQKEMSVKYTKDMILESKNRPVIIIARLKDKDM